MDEEGFVYFKGRSKRMIISSGYNIYPAQMENILDGNKMVQMSCVIGLPDAYKMQKVKAFVVLKPGYQPAEEVWLKLMAYCKKHVAKYAMPCDIEFRDELPKTLVGKVAYRILEEEELAKYAAMTEEQRKLPDPVSLKRDQIAAAAALLEGDDMPVMEAAETEAAAAEDSISE